MPVRERSFDFDRFPPFFDGLLPEGVLLEALLKRRKIDRHDYFGQILAVGEDLVGAVTVREAQG
jgi:serine/threonine-protein kinase HipA